MLSNYFYLEPFHVLGLLEHVVSVPTGNWYECHSIGIVADLLEV